MKKVFLIIGSFMAIALLITQGFASGPVASASGSVSATGGASAGAAGKQAAALGAGTGFTYQGSLTTGGSPANGQYDLQFTLFDDPTAGNQIGSVVTIANQTVSGGLFTVVLDFGPGAFQGDARWLQIAVRPSGNGSYTPLSPRQALTPAPYALSLSPGAIVNGSLGSPLLSLNNGNQAGLYAQSATNNGVVAVSNSGSASGLYAVNNAGSGGWGVYGQSGGNLSTAVVGWGTGNSANGVLGVGNGTGVVGISSHGNGVFATGPSSGVYGTSSAGSGVMGVVSDTQPAIIGLNSGPGTGAAGLSIQNSGVAGTSWSVSSSGVYGENDNNGWGAFGRVLNATIGVGVGGESMGTYGIGMWAHGRYAGVWSVSNQTGVYGEGGSSPGVYGTSAQSAGVESWISGTQNSLVGLNGGSGNGVYGESSRGNGVSGKSDTPYATGVYGENDLGGWGAYGRNLSDGGIGVGAEAPGANATGVRAFAGNTGVNAIGGALGIRATNLNAGGKAGLFIGDVQVTGNLSKGGGSFKIDDPIDPANKYLYHSFVESPDMMDIYNGNVTTDAQGDATITMPDYFQALNRDFRYQLTPVGQFAQVMVSSEMKGNQFSIKTDKPNVKVSWQVTGIRQDPYANAHRIPVEQDKPAGEKGKYLYPKEYGQPEAQGIYSDAQQQVPTPPAAPQAQMPSHAPQTPQVPAAPQASPSTSVPEAPEMPQMPQLPGGNK